ncbi:hypothetical protein EGW08_005470 [Elysia chlorotica]|uniref:Uncharacterized protein n=1 Tax=Elysia chlorotica TaxID=188477 RepID=A0A3S0ZZC0_ELYCH|nr:hypothetical protein EGW08_005470 [Elysia chlorotica]
MRRRQAFGYEGAAFFLHSDSSNSDEGYFGGLGMEEHQDNENPHGRGRPRGRGRQHRGRGRGGQNIGPFAPPMNPHQAQLGNQGNFPIVNPGNVPIANPGNVPIANPGNVPIANPGNVPIANPGNVPIANPGNVPIANPGNVPIANPGNVPIANPGNVPIANPGNVPIAHPGNVPIAHPGNVRFANPGNVLFVNQAQGPYMNQGNVFNVQRYQAQYTNQAYIQGLGQPMIRNNFPNANPAQMQQMNQMQGLNPDQVQMHAIVPGPSQMQAINQGQWPNACRKHKSGQGQLHTIHPGQDQVHVFNPNQGQIPVSNSGHGQIHTMHPGQGQTHAVNTGQGQMHGLNPDQGQMHALNPGQGHMHVMNPSPHQLHTINQSQSQRNTLNPGQGHNRFISPDQDQMHALVNPSQVQNVPQSHDVSINQDHGHDQDQDPPTNQSGASSASKVSELRITIPSHDQPMNVNVAPTVSQAQMSTIGRPILPPARQVENVNQGNNPNVGQDLVPSFGNVSIASANSNENVFNAPNVNPVQTQHANTGNFPHLNQGQDQSNDRGRSPNIQPNQEQRMKPSAVPEISQSQNVPSQRVDQRQDKKLGANRSSSSNVLPGQCGTNQGLPPRERPVLLQTPSVAPGGSPPKRGGFGPKNMFYVNMGGAHYDFFTGGHRRNAYSNRGVRVDRRSASVRGHIRPNYAPARVRRLSENADVRRKKTETASVVVTKSDPSTSGSGDDASEKVKDSKCNKKKALSSPVATGGENPGKNQQEKFKNKKSSSGGNSGSASTNSGDDTSGGNEGSNESDNSNDSKSDKGKTDRARRKSGGNKSVAGKDSRGDSKNVRQSTKSGSGTDVSEGSASSGGGADSGVKSGSKGSGSGDNGGNGGSDVSDSSGDSGERKDGSGSSGGDSGGGSGGSGGRGGCGRGGNGPYGGGSGGGGGSGAGGSGSGAGGCGDNSGGSGGTGDSGNSGNGGNMGNDGKGGNGGSGSKGNSDGNDGSGGKRNSRFPSGSGGSDRSDGNVGNGGNVGRDGNENKNDEDRHTGQDQSIQGCARQVDGTVLETEGSSGTTVSLGNQQNSSNGGNKFDKGTGRHYESQCVERDPATERKTSNQASGGHQYKSNQLHSRGVNAQAHSRMNLPMDPNALPPGFVLTHNPKNIVEGRSVNTAGESDLVVDETGYHSSPRFGYYNGMLVNLDLAHLTVPEFIDVSQTNPPPENIPINLNTVPEVLKALTQYLIQNHPSSEASQIVLSKKELRPMYDENTQRTIDASVQNVQQEQPTIIGAPKYPVPNAPLLPTPHRMPVALENVHFAPRVESAAQLNAPVYPAPSNVQFVPSQPLIHEPLRTASIPSQFNVPPPSGMEGFLPPFNNRMPMHVPNNNPHLLSAPQSGFNLNAPGNVFIRPQANFVQPGAESVTGKQVYSPVPIYQVNNNTRIHAENCNGSLVGKDTIYINRLGLWNQPSAQRDGDYIPATT